MTADTRLHKLYNRARLDDRQVNELIGLASGIIADGLVNQLESEFLHKWLVAHVEASGNPVVGLLLNRVDQVLEDGALDSDEAAYLLETLTRFSAGDFELGETLKSSSLPLDEPPPRIVFPRKSFCFTGTFAFGTRKDCEQAVIKKGGAPCSLTKATSYLVIGAYATDAWAHSSFGRKIENAVEMRGKGVPIALVCEEYWVGELRQ